MTDREIAEHVEMAIEYLKDKSIIAEKLTAIITKMHQQMADDRCVWDLDELYTTIGLPVPDRRVGNKLAMVKNCIDFIEHGCEAGGWKSYKELLDEIEQLKLRIHYLEGELELHEPQ